MRIAANAAHVRFFIYTNVDPGRIGLPPPQCECGVIPLYYGPRIAWANSKQKREHFNCFPLRLLRRISLYYGPEAGKK